MTVEIGCVQDRDANRIGLNRGSRTRQRWKSTEQSRATGESQKIAARPCSVYVRHCSLDSAERLTINETQFQWNSGADAAQGVPAWAGAETANRRLRSR